MRKNLLFSALFIIAIIACTLFITDGLTYVVTSLMALVIMSAIKYNKSWVMKMTRWGKASPNKAQLLITVLQFMLMSLGMIGGYNFKQLGYELSDSTAFVFSTIMITGFLLVHFLPRRRTIAIPAEVNKHRIIFMSIALSSFVLMVITGNRIADMYPNSPITNTLNAIDGVIFQGNSTEYADLSNVASESLSNEEYMEDLQVNTSGLAMYASYAAYESKTIEPTNKEKREKLKAEKKIKRLEKKKARLINLLKNKRLALAAGIGAGAIILIILLVIPLCAGICLIISGFAGGGIGHLLLGALLTGGSIWGIVKLSKSRNRKNIKEP